MKAEMGSLPDEVQAHSGISFCHDRFVWFACYTVNGCKRCIVMLSSKRGEADKDEAKACHSTLSRRWPVEPCCHNVV